MPLIALIVIAAVLYAVFALFVAKASVIDAFMANAIFNGLATFIPLLMFFGLMARKNQGPVTKHGVVMSVTAGPGPHRFFDFVSQNFCARWQPGLRAAGHLRRRHCDWLLAWLCFSQRAHFSFAT
jgi:hypothetical protein